MSAQPTTPSAKKILVVDDDEVILKTLSITLSSNGYYVYLASDGPEAVRVVSRERPDLILLDLIFPVDAANVGGALQDGFLIMQWLRRMGEAEDIPIIIMSGDNSTQEKQRALDAGAVAFFTKPIDNAALLAAIAKVLGGGTSTAAPLQS
ncbi:MAG TPA: response regulator [Candidatus Acidoferrum sp.]|nr:response regulator [Candidatus Acidoferrum sp.]